MSRDESGSESDEGQPRIPSADVAAYLARLARERGYSPRTIASYQIDLAVLETLIRELAATRQGPTLARPAPARPAPARPRAIAPARSHTNAADTLHGAQQANQAHDARGADRVEAIDSGPSVPDWTLADERAVRSWVAGVSRQGLSPRSVARRLSAWRGFYDWLAEAKGLAGNPVRGVRAPKAPRRLPSALAPDQAVRLVDSPDADGFEAIRDRAIYELLYSSGLRLSELVGLDCRYFEPEAGLPRSASWLELEQAQVHVTGKGAKRRTVPVGAAARDALTRWLLERGRLLSLNASSDPRALFLSARGSRLSARSIQARLARHGIARGIPARVHPHMLRHSFASHLLQSSGDLRAVQELLGHASIASTQVYTALDFQRLAAVYDAAHPRARRTPAKEVLRPTTAPDKAGRQK